MYSTRNKSSSYGHPTGILRASYGHPTDSRWRRSEDRLGQTTESEGLEHDQIVDQFRSYR